LRTVNTNDNEEASKRWRWNAGYMRLIRVWVLHCKDFLLSLQSSYSSPPRAAAANYGPGFANFNNTLTLFKVVDYFLLSFVPVCSNPFGSELCIFFKN